jgi:hypothetical protein
VTLSYGFGKNSTQQVMKSGLAIKNPPKKPTQKNPPKKTHLKKPTKNVFFGGFFGFFNFFFIFYENNSNFSL